MKRSHTPLTGRQLLLAGAVLPALASCAGDAAHYREQPLSALAKDFGVCASSHVVLRSAQPGIPVEVSGCDLAATQVAPIFQAASLTKPLVIRGATTGACWAT
ncbi:MAG: hypothetical protein KGN32_08515 [Burkholderiales bacterium]|nr:hypothetical protein [Burkholderiales bacterium]